MQNYKTNGKAVYLIQYHIVFCPKYRRSFLVNEVKTKLEELIRETCIINQTEILSMQVMPDHVHLFVSCNYKLPVYKLIKAIKGKSSNVLRKEFPELCKVSTLWSRSFFVSSIGQVSSETIQKYIDNQWVNKLKCKE